MKTVELCEDLAVLTEKLESLQMQDSVFLISGATGFIGSLLVKLFAEYHQKSGHNICVYAMARSKEKVKLVFSDFFHNETEAEESGIHFLYGDVCDPLPELPGCDYIIHTASPTASRYFISKPVEVIRSICLGTENILRFAAAHKIRGMVNLSSMEVFGKTEPSHRLSEQELGYVDLHSVRSCYPEGKRLSECLCRCYAEEYRVPVCTARLAQTFGAGLVPGESRVFAQFMQQAVKGNDIVLHTEGRSMGNYVYSRDAISAILLLLRNGTPGESYTVVNESSAMTIKELADLIAEHFSNGESRVVFDIPEDNHFGYAPETKMRLSAEKLKALGWQPEVDMEEALKRMLPDIRAMAEGN